MIVNTRKTQTRPHKLLHKRATRGTDGIYRMSFFAQFSIELEDMVHAIALHCPQEEFAQLVTRGQMIEAVNEALVNNGIATIAEKRTTGMALFTVSYTAYSILVRTKLIRLFPDFFPKFARPKS